MSNETTPECLNHKDNRNVQVRLDYMLLYRSESKAKIIRILESWTNTKYGEWYKGIADSKEQHSEPPAEDLWITMSYDQFSLFVYGTVQHDTIKQQVDELVALKHIQRRPHPEFPYGPPQYLLNRALVQEELDKVEIPPNLFDLAPIFVSPRKKHTPQEKYPHPRGKKQGGDPGKIPPGWGGVSPPSNNISKNTKNHTENQSMHSDANRDLQDGAFAPTPSEVSLSESNHTGYEEALAYLTSHNGYEHIDKSHTPAEVIRLAQSIREQQAREEEQAPAEPAHENDSHSEPPQQQTLMAPAKSQSAKVDTGKQSGSNKRRKGSPQLTLAGQHILELYDASKPVKRKTMLNADNIGRANRIADVGASDEDFARAVQRMRDDPFLKANNIAIDLDFVDRKIEKFLTIVDQEQEAATQAEKARREAEERAKAQPPRPPAVKPTALEQQLRDMEARYLQGGK